MTGSGLKKMSKELFFVRHGESIVNRTQTISNRVSDHTPLTEVGRQQAQELLARIKGRKISSIYSSPLTRARETAEIIADGFGLEVEISDALREPDCGEIEGRSDAEAWKMHSDQEEAWIRGDIDYHLRGGESLRDVRDRFVPFIEEVLSNQREDTGNMIFVSHGSILVNTLPYILTNINAHFTHSAPLGNCSYVLTDSSESGLWCIEWGEIPVVSNSKNG